LTFHCQGGEAIDRSNWTWVVGLSVADILIAILAWRGFDRRDIRVAGEGAWQWPRLSSLARRLPELLAVGPRFRQPKGLREAVSTFGLLEISHMSNTGIGYSVNVLRASLQYNIRDNRFLISVTLRQYCME
jgi:hypothetical protein